MSWSDALDPNLADGALALVDAAGRAGLQPRVTSTIRSYAEQSRLYRRFLAGLQKFPVAPPGSSAHEYGAAFDMVVSPMEALADVGATWQSWGGGWSGGDAVHFELQGASALYRSAWGEATVDQAFADLLSFVYGSTVASILRLVPGLSNNQLLAYLANPGALAIRKPSSLLEDLAARTGYNI